MTEITQPNLTPEELDKLQRLRASVVAFQNSIGSLPAKETDNAHNLQFNQLRLEAKSLLKDRDFDKKVPRSVTEDMMADRFQKVVVPRLFGIITIGVILVLLGLGINSIILEDLIINTLGCLVSSAGFLLVVGAFAVFSLSQSRKRLSNYGDLYQYCEALLYQINHTLNMTIPNWAERAAAIPEIPSIVDLTLDSLQKQAEDWQEKFTTLESQRLALGEDVPLELTVNMDFVRRELDRVNHEIDSLRGHNVMLLPEGDSASPPLLAPENSTPQVVEEIPVEAVQTASAHTLGMPAAREEDPAATAAEFEEVELGEDTLEETIEETNDGALSAPVSMGRETASKPNEESSPDMTEDEQTNTSGISVSEVDESSTTDSDSESKD